MRLRAHRRVITLLLLLLVLGTAGAVFVYTNPGYPVDDALITYQYARNIARGKGFVYNEGQRVQGTTTPLFTLLMTAIAIVGIDLVKAGTWIGILAGLALCAIVYSLGLKLQGPLAGFVAALLTATSGHLAANASSGMETTLYTTLILGTLYCYVLHRHVWAAALAGVCVLTRLDGLAAATAILLILTIRRKRLPLREAMVFMAVALPWFVFATLYFGSPLPTTLFAKQSHTIDAGMLWMVRFLLNSPFELLWLPIVLWCASLFSPIRTTTWDLLPIITWLLLYVLAFTVAGIDMYDWYNVPPIPIIYLLFAMALVSLVRDLDLRQPWFSSSVTYALAGFVLLYQVKYTLALVPSFRRKAIAVEGTRKEVAVWLAENTPSDSTIATDGIGYIGYYSQRRIVDLAGLVTPYAIGRPYSDTLSRFEPDYAVSVVSTDRGHPFKSLEFLSDYERVKSWTGAGSFMDPHVLYQRK